MVILQDNACYRFDLGLYVRYNQKKFSPRRQQLRH